MPLGIPVDPEVYINSAGSSAFVCARLNPDESFVKTSENSILSYNFVNILKIIFQADIIVVGTCDVEASSKNIVSH